MAIRLFLPFLVLLAWIAPLSAEESAPAGQPLRLVAYNIKHGRGMDNEVNLKRIANVLRALKPDLIALQEIDHTCTRSGTVDEAAALGKLLGMEHRFGKFMNFQGGQYGLAILSRFPIEKTIRHQLAPGAEPRCALEIVVRPTANGNPLSFLSIHNDWTREDFRVAQVKDLIQGLAEQKHAVILAGDFNAQPDDKSLALLTKAGFSMVAKKGGRKTFPSPAPKVEIDYFMTRGIKFSKPPTCSVHDERVASDHRPIVMELSLPK